MQTARAQRRSRGSRCLAAASLALALGVAAATWLRPVAATERGPSAALGRPAPLAPDFDSLPLSARPPDRSEDPEIVRLWEKGLRFESERLFLESSRVWEEITRRRPRESHAYWRIARNYLRYAQALPPSRGDEQLEYYTLTETWAGRGLDVDPDCGECYLYEFAGLGKRLALGSVVTAARRASELARLLDRGMKLAPRYRDNEWNSELGNLYYAAAAFYRVLPEWRWLEWVIGVRGDKRRSLSYIRKANEISRGRIDYQLALGATLLCVGVDKDEPALVREASGVLGQLPNLPTRLETDEQDRKIAQIMLARPERACEYTHHDWIDIDEELGHG